ncbi:MAG: hypothetical protein WBP10_17590 [Thermoanaerobaculia bacterium]
MIFRRTLWLLTTGALGLLVGSLNPILAQTAEELIQSKHVMIRHRLDPAEPVYVGQPVRVWVEVMTRTWFLEAPRYPSTLEVRDSIVIPPDAFGVNSSEKIGGQNYAVQGRSYTVFPQTTGRFEVPPVPVVLVVARDDASRSPAITLQTDPIVIEASLPAGAEGHGLVLSTSGLSVRETYDRTLEGIRVGESFKRQVTMTIQDSVAMLLPPVPFEAAEGLAVYPGRPEVEDKRDRGSLTGTRIDRATYVMEAEGSYRLPETNIWWWNLRTSKLEQEVLPAVEFTVEANAELAAEHMGQPEEAEVSVAKTETMQEPGWGWKEWALVLGALALGILVARRIGKAIKKGRDPVVKKEESEEIFFYRFEDAARSDDPAGTYQALLGWLDRFELVGSPASARSFVAMASDEKLAREYETLEDGLFGRNNRGDETVWSGRALAAAVGRARKQLRTQEYGSSSLVDVLPPLNP